MKFSIIAVIIANHRWCRKFAKTKLVVAVKQCTCFFNEKQFSFMRKISIKIELLS